MISQPFLKAHRGSLSPSLSFHFTQLISLFLSEGGLSPSPPLPSTLLQGAPPQGGPPQPGHGPPPPLHPLPPSTPSPPPPPPPLHPLTPARSDSRAPNDPILIPLRPIPHLLPSSQTLPPPLLPLLYQIQLHLPHPRPLTPIVRFSRLLCTYTDAWDSYDDESECLCGGWEGTVEIGSTGEEVVGGEGDAGG